MRFDSASYFIGSVKLTGDFQTYYVPTKKTSVIFCETRLAPAQLKSQKIKPLTRVIVYFFGSLGDQAQTYYKKGDYVTVQGRLKLFKISQPKINITKVSGNPFNNFSIGDGGDEYQYHLNVLNMSLICRP
jgi:hypothetical protein|tara:strand:- start:76 stop:465 length:390 start_codon:yes stop_codon:yes gene_type:complete